MVSGLLIEAVTASVLPGLPSSDTSGPCPVTQVTALLVLLPSSAPSLPSLVRSLKSCSSLVNVFTGVILRRVFSTKHKKESLSALIQGRIKLSFSSDFGILENKVVHILNETLNFSKCLTATVFVSSDMGELLCLISRCHSCECNLNTRMKSFCEKKEPYLLNRFLILVKTRQLLKGHLFKNKL